MPKAWWVVLWAGAGAVRLALLWVPGHTVDVAAFTAWAVRLAEVGPPGFYRPGVFVDYLPGYLLVLWPVGLLARAIPHLAPVWVKLPPAAADLAVAYLLWRLGGPRRTLAALAYLWNPAVLLAGPWWGQVESVAVAWTLGSALAWWEGRPGWAGVLFALGALTKPQYALAGVLLLVGSAQGRPAHLLAAAGGCVAAVVASGLVFGLSPWGLARVALGASATYPYGSVNALNLWYLLGLNWRPDSAQVLGLPAVVWGGLLTLAAAVWAGRLVAGRGDVGLGALAGGWMVAAAFSLATRMHERYLFPAVPFTLLAWSHGRAASALWVALSLALLGNLLYGFSYLSSFPQYRTPGWAAVWHAFGAPVPELFCVAGLLATSWAGWALRRTAHHAYPAPVVLPDQGSAAGASSTPKGEGEL